MVINNAFNFVVYVGFISLGTMVSPLLSFRLIRKGISGVKKYGWGKFPKNFISPDYGSTSLEVILVGVALGLLWLFLIYDFFSHRLPEIITYLS